MFCLSTYLRHILAAQAFLCILLGYTFLNLAFAMRRNWFILFIVICCEWFVTSLCTVGNHHT
jgi:predicted small integral membrane protein